MKNSLLLIFWILSTYVFAQNIEWAHTIGGTGRDQPQSIASDQDGNVIIAGTFVGTPIEFSDSDIVLHGSDSTDIYLYKKSPSGALLWATVLFSQGHDHVNDIGVDNEGNVYVVGWFRKPMNLGNSENPTTLVSVGQRDAFVAKYNTDGNLLSAYSLGGGINDEFFTVSFDHEDNLVLSGRFFFQIDFDFSNASHIIHTEGLTFLKLTTDLEFISVSTFDLREVYPNKVAFTAEGEMIFAGRHRGEISFPGGTVFPPTSFDTVDFGFVIKFNTNNEFVWGASVYGSVFQMVTDMFLTESGEIYVTGDFTVGCKFLGNPGYYNYQSDSGSRDIFFAKLTPSGAFEWIKVIGGSSFDEVRGMERDTDGNFILTGRYAGTMDVDPSLATVTITAEGGAATFIAKYTADGEYISAQSLQNAGYNAASGLALSPTNDIYVTGWFTELMHFDLTQSGFSFYSNGVQDTYLVKLSGINVGLNEKMGKSKIALFPNPTDDFVKIEADGIKKVECFDIHGKMVVSETVGFQQNRHTLSVAHLPAGIYFIRVSANNQSSFSEKLVIIR